MLAGYLTGAFVGAGNARWVMLAAGLLPIAASLVTWVASARDPDIVTAPDPA